MLRRTLALLIVTAAPVASGAQSHPLVGKWIVDYAGGIRVENGEPTITRTKGTLDVVAQGDSLIATLTQAAVEGLPARPLVRLAALKADGAASFIQNSKARVNANGEESAIDIRSTWVLRVNGDTLEGSLAREAPGHAGDLPGLDLPPQPVTGKRAS